MRKKAKNSRPKPFSLGMAIIENHHKGYPDMLVFLPLCSVCGKVITNFTMANLLFKEDRAKRQPAGKLNGAPITLHPASIWAVHKRCGQACDDLNKPGIGWKPLETVIRDDQRYEWER